MLTALLGALPDLGVAGVVLIVLIVGKRLLDQERDYFSQERTSYRTEARTDREDLKKEIKNLKRENESLEDRIDKERERRRMDPTA